MTMDVGTGGQTTVNGPSPYGMTIGELVNLMQAGNSAQKAWASQQLSARTGGVTNGMQSNEYNQDINQYTDPNVSGIMQLLLLHPEMSNTDIFNRMTGPQGNGLQGLDNEGWMKIINDTSNNMRNAGIQSDPTHGYPPDSPFNPMNPHNILGAGGAPAPVPGTTTTPNPTGTTDPAGDANTAYSNQLRQTYMDSPLYNPNGANTYGIQNGTLANLKGAFGGGVLPPAGGPGGNMPPPVSDPGQGNPGTGGPTNSPPYIPPIGNPTPQPPYGAPPTPPPYPITSDPPPGGGLGPAPVQPPLPVPPTPPNGGIGPADTGTGGIGQVPTPPPAPAPGAPTGGGKTIQPWNPNPDNTGTTNALNSMGIPPPNDTTKPYNPYAQQPVQQSPQARTNMNVPNYFGGNMKFGS